MIVYFPVLNAIQISETYTHTHIHIRYFRGGKKKIIISNMARVVGSIFICIHNIHIVTFVVYRMYICIINVSNYMIGHGLCMCVFVCYAPLNIFPPISFYFTFSHHINRNSVEIIRYVRVFFSLFLLFAFWIFLYTIYRVSDKWTSLDFIFFHSCYIKNSKTKSKELNVCLFMYK